MKIESAEEPNVSLGNWALIFNQVFSINKFTGWDLDLSSDSGECGDSSMEGRGTWATAITINK